MKITKTQLKQIIKEEIERTMLKENIISDMVDKIVDSGEDFGDWIQDNAREVAKIAKKVGSGVEELIDDAGKSYQRALHKVGTATGLELSKKQKYARKKRALDQKEADAEAARQARSDAFYQAARDKKDARHARDKELDRQRRIDNPFYDDDFADAHASQREREKEEEDRRFRDRRRDPGGPPTSKSSKRPYMLHDPEKDDEWMTRANRESIDRDKLARIVAEELQKVLKNK